MLDDLLEDWEADSAARLAEPGLRTRRAPVLRGGARAPATSWPATAVPYRWLDVDGPRGAPAPGRRPAGRRRAAGARLRGRRGAGAARPRARSRREDRPAHGGGAPLLRPRHRRRRAGRPGGGGLRRVRGPAHAPRRAARDRGPGGAELADRELPRVSGRPQRRRPRAARDGPGAAPGRGDAHGPRGARHPRERPGAGGRARRRRPRSAATACSSRRGSTTRRLEAPGVEAPHRARASTTAPRPPRPPPSRARTSSSWARRTRPGRRPSTSPPGPPGDDAVPRRRAREEHVPLPRRAHPLARERRGHAARGGHGGRRATAGSRSWRSPSRDGRSACPCPAAFVFIGARPQTDWLGDAVARDARTGSSSPAPGVQRIDGRHRWRLERDPFPLETSLPGVFVAGRRPRPVDQARGVGGRRGLDGGAARAPVPRRDHLTCRSERSPARIAILADLADEELARARAAGRERPSSRASTSSARARRRRSCPLVLDGELETTRVGRRRRAPAAPPRAGRLPRRDLPRHRRGLRRLDALGGR